MCINHLLYLHYVVLSSLLARARFYDGLGEPFIHDSRIVES